MRFLSAQRLSVSSSFRLCGTLHDFPKTKLCESYADSGRTSPPNECPVAGRSLETLVYRRCTVPEIRFVQLID